MTIEGRIQQHIIMLKIPQVDIDIALSVVSKDELVAILDSIAKDKSVYQAPMVLRQHIRKLKLDNKVQRLANAMVGDYDSNLVVNADDQVVIDLTCEYIEQQYDIHNDDRIRAEQYRYLRNVFPSAVNRIPDEILATMPTLQLSSLM